MKTYIGTLRSRARATVSSVKICGRDLGLAAALSGSLALGMPANAQTQNSAQAGVPDAQQAIALLQTLARGQNASQGALSTAQVQMLSQYLQRESQSAAATASVAAMRRTPSQESASSGTVETAVQMPSEMPARTTAGTAERKPGTARIGVVQPKAQMGQGNTGRDVAEPLRAVIIQYLSGPALQVVPIAAMMPTQIEAECKEKGLDYVLYSSISQKMNSGGFGMLQKAMPLASMIPMVGAVGGMATMVASSAAGAAMSGAAGLSGSVKAKSEVTYEYRLVAPGNSTPILASSTKAKAKRDGEDIVTPLIEQAAGAILAEVGNKK